MTNSFIKKIEAVKNDMEAQILSADTTELAKDLLIAFNECPQGINYTVSINNISDNHLLHLSDIKSRLEYRIHFFDRVYRILPEYNDFIPKKSRLLFQSVYLYKKIDKYIRDFRNIN
jgi:hypothetical protein